MPSKDFVFVLVRDRTYQPPSRYLLEYIRFRYPDAEAHKVLNVADAHKLILKALGPYDTIGEVHVSAHASPLGYVWGRLRAGDQFRSIADADALVYARTDPAARTIATRGDTGTVVEIHGCNLGRSPPALSVWRDLFGGAKGVGIAPRLYQHYAVTSPILEATWGRKVVFRQLIHHTDEVDDYVAKAVRAVSAATAAGSLRKGAADVLRQRANRDLDGYLLARYGWYVSGGELTTPQQGLSEAQAVTLMRTVFDAYRGTPTTFLFDSLDESLWLREENLRTKMKPKGAIFPEDAAWTTSHHREPGH